MLELIGFDMNGDGRIVLLRRDPNTFETKNRILTLEEARDRHAFWSAHPASLTHAGEKTPETLLDELQAAIDLQEEMNQLEG